MKDNKPSTHAAKSPAQSPNGTRPMWVCECSHGEDHWIGPLDAQVLETFAKTPGGMEQMSVKGEVFAVRDGHEGPWTCGVSQRIGCWPPAEDEKLFPCPECARQVPLMGGMLADHDLPVVGRWCPGSSTVPKGTMRLGVRDWSSTPRTGKTVEQEAWKLQEQLTDHFVSNAMRVHVQLREQEWREMIQAALKLVEENPRNEPMRTEISRPAVERMLAEDLERTKVRDAFTWAGRAEVAKELFDLGWRPTIDRLVR